MKLRPKKDVSVENPESCPRVAVTGKYKSPFHKSDNVCFMSYLPPLPPPSLLPILKDQQMSFPKLSQHGSISKRKQSGHSQNMLESKELFWKSDYFRKALQRNTDWIQQEICSMLWYVFQNSN